MPKTGVPRRREGREGGISPSRPSLLRGTPSFRMPLQIPLFDPHDGGHATGFVIFPLLGLFIAGGVFGFALGCKRRRITEMLSGAAMIAGLGYCLIGVWGLLVCSLMPLMYVYGKS